MSVLIDLTGQQFGRLTVIHRSGKDNNGLVRWLCVCSCGVEKEVRGQDLRRGRQVSCGCWKDENTATRDYRHGQAGTRLHRIWKNMKSRCYNPRVQSFKDYGARGIEICPEWCNDFGTFSAWALSHGYEDHLTIDRIDVNGNYCPANCRWVTRSEQNRNKRTPSRKELHAIESTARPSP